MKSLLGTDPTDQKLVVCALIEAIGNGLFVVLGTIFYVQVIGIDIRVVGAVLSASAVVGILAAVPFGRYIDRHDSRTVLLVALVCQGLSIVFIALSTSLMAFAAATVTNVLAAKLAFGARGVIMRGSHSPDKVGLRARMRAALNIGASLSAPIAGLALSVKSATAFRLFLIAASLAYFASAALIAKVNLAPRAEQAKDEDSRLETGNVWRDRPFVIVTLLSVVIAMHYGIFEIAVPIWVIQNTSAPDYMVSVLFFVNTITVILFQVRLSRGTEDARGGRRALLLGGLLIFAGFSVFGIAHYVGHLAAIVVLAAGGLLHAFGEVLQASGTWAVSYALAPVERSGEYQSFFGTAASVSLVLAPIVAGFTAGHGSGLMWFAAGLGVAAACAAVGVIATQVVARDSSQGSRVDVA